MPPETPATRSGNSRREGYKGPPPRRGSRSFARAAEEAVRPLLRKRGFRESALIRQWREIIGPQLASRTAPVSLARGVLTVRVEPAFATEFQHRTGLVMERIATTYGFRAVNRIVLKQGPVHGRSRPPRPEHRVPTPTAAVRREVAALTDGVRHAPLREALTRLGEAMGSRRPMQPGSKDFGRERHGGT